MSIYAIHQGGGLECGRNTGMCGIGSWTSSSSLFWSGLVCVWVWDWGFCLVANAGGVGCVEKDEDMGIWWWLLLLLTHLLCSMIPYGEGGRKEVAAGYLVWSSIASIANQPTSRQYYIGQEATFEREHELTYYFIAFTCSELLFNWQPEMFGRHELPLG